ncbi:threonine aldolase family protein [Sphingomonas nostoxanthinifaciens]|uniref:threonine aldolase family protein n=1 Tax=Sphingomonas nostoxanthinifaciens TaxID=2872652 RepID=UPI001CC21166|nr:beta-eliminating lyase-related protein [Sphingomonas nostoxanthinifaciens]UAK25231.1 threonine aldolase [Sphingomonas nostoxanthinifaciens]
MNEADHEAKAACTRFLSHHLPVAPRAMLERLAAHDTAELRADVYGEGGAIGLLERRAVEMLGKPSGRFFIKGVTAQLSVLSAYAEARGTRNVVVHPLSHLDHDEANAMERVGHLNAIRLGRHAPFGVEDLQRIADPLAAVVVELPLRRAGYLLPDFDALVAIADWCRAADVPLHFDGARLWEAAAGYGVSPARLASLADSIYVSFYKGLGGLGGALVAGSGAFVASLAAWKTRYGGDLYTAYPQAISALIGLDTQLPRMVDYVARARALASRLGTVPGIILQPAVPHTNAFQIWMRGDPAALAERNRSFAHDHRVWLFGGFQPTALAGHCMAEIAIGDGSDHVSIDEAADWVEAFLA